MTKEELIKRLELIDNNIDELESAPVAVIVKDIRDVRNEVADLISELESDEDIK